MSIFLNHFDPSCKLAAPSWVISGTVSENCRFLSGRVDEIALLFFETESCLAYGEADLPAELASLDVSFHIHHPLDLPWEKGGRAVAEIVIALGEKAAHLNLKAHVVHPPACSPNAIHLLEEFAETIEGSKIFPSKVLFENIRENSLIGMTGLINELGFKICLDLGHILAYGQHELLNDPVLPELVSMLHLNAPGEGGRHESLQLLDRDGKVVLDRCMEFLSQEGTVTVEVFYEKGFFDSVQFLNEYCIQC